MKCYLCKNGYPKIPQVLIGYAGRKSQIQVVKLFTFLCFALFNIYPVKCKY